jgi:hypothetical protein
LFFPGLSADSPFLIAGNMKTVFVFLFATVSATVSAQLVRSDHVVDNTSGGFMEFAQAAPAAATNVYLSNEWSTGILSLKNGSSFQNLQLRYDIKNDYIEVKLPTGVRIISVDQLSGFALGSNSAPRNFVVARSISPGLSGVAEVLVRGEHSLYMRYVLQVTRANFNPALNIGSKVETYQIRKQILVVSADGFVDITKINKRKNPFTVNDKVSRYIDEQRLDVRNLNDLVLIVAYWNEIGADQ